MIIIRKTSTVRDTVNLLIQALEQEIKSPECDDKVAIIMQMVTVITELQTDLATYELMRSRGYYAKYYSGERND